MNGKTRNGLRCRYRARLWLHDSGSGAFAVVGLSKPRQNRTSTGLALGHALAQKNAAPRCAIQVIDLRSGDAVHWLRIEGVVQELYDVVTLPGCVRPMAIGFQSDEIRRVITVGA